MIRIAITPAAFDAIAATLPLGSVGCKPELNEKGERLIWLERAHVDKLAAMRGPGESYSDGILRRWWNLMRGTGARTGGFGKRGQQRPEGEFPASRPDPRPATAEDQSALGGTARQSLKSD